jgi:hypothetical protein
MPPAGLSSSAPSARWQRWRSLVAARRVHLTSHRIWILGVLALAFAYYVWTADTSIPFVWDTHQPDPYNLLTTAFLHGHTYLPIPVPSGLLHLSNPYDPAQNGPYQASIHDLLFRNGRLYSVWGPTPVLALFLPFRLTGMEMSPSFAVALFSFVGLVCAVKLMHVLVRRFAPATPNWLLVVGTVGLALANTVPFLLRRPAQYEVAISCGLAFEMLGLLLVCTAVLRHPISPARLAWGSLCLGLAMGARLSMLAGGAVPLAAAIYLIRRRGYRGSILIHAVVPVALCILLLGLYNVDRFGAIDDFGTLYQLAGVDPATIRSDALSSVPPGMFSYLLMPPTFSITFPHVFLNTTALYPFPFPQGYEGSPGVYAEPAGGLLPTIPLTLLLLSLPVRWRRRPQERSALAVVGGLTLLGLAIMGLLALALPGTTERYEVDYASVFLIAATVMWASVLNDLPARTRTRRIATTLGIAATVFASMIGIALGFEGYYNLLDVTHPNVFNILEDIASPAATLVTEVAGKPVIARVVSPTPVSLPAQNLTTFDQGGAGTWLGGGWVEVVVMSPSSQHLLLQSQTTFGPGVAPNARFHVRANSADGTVSSTPATGGVLDLPIKVDTGLNRIWIDLEAPTPAAPTPEQLYLGTMILTPTRR